MHNYFMVLFVFFIIYRLYIFLSNEIMKLWFFLFNRVFIYLLTYSNATALPLLWSNVLQSNDHKQAEGPGAASRANCEEQSHHTTKVIGDLNQEFNIIIITFQCLQRHNEILTYLQRQGADGCWEEHQDLLTISILNS